MKGQALGGLGLSDLLFFFAVLFLRKEQFHILLRFYDVLHLIPRLSVLWVECFFLGEQSRILCIQVFHFGQLFQAGFIESGFRRLMQRDFFPVRFQKIWSSTRIYGKHRIQAGSWHS